MVKTCNIDETIASRVKDALTKEPQKTCEVITKSTAAKNTTVSYLQALAKRGDVRKTMVNGRAYWRLP